MELDIDKLRKHLLNYYGAAVFAGLPMALLDVAKVETGSDDDILRIAMRNKVDLSKFVSNKDY